MKVVDTSYLIAFFDLDDARHAKVRREFPETDVLVGAEVLVETLGVLKVKAGRRAADTALADLMQQANVAWSTETDIPGTYRLYAADPGLSFVDASVVQAALRHQAELLTLDDKQLAAHKRLHRRGKPG